jgi:large subunit ribosomal protein L17
MRHQKPFRKLSRQRSHYRALLRNLALALFQKERIRTTLVKAKESRSFIEKIITLGKEGSLHSRRRAIALMGNKSILTAGKRVDAVEKVFTEFKKRYAARAGGYTRIIRLAPRPGDAAPMAYLELVDAQLKLEKGGDTKDSKAPAKSAATKAPKKKASAKSEKAAAAA